MKKRPKINDIGALGQQTWGQILFLLLYILLASLIVFIFRPAYFYSLILVLGVASLINFSWLRRARVKVFFFSVICTLLFAPPIELLARLANVWDVQSIFPRPFGLIPLENMIFAFLNFFWGLTFYEHFVDRDRKRNVSPRAKFLIGLMIVFSAGIYWAFFSHLVDSGFGYSVIAVISLVIPAVLIFCHNPHLLRKAILPTIFFAIVFWVYESVSLAIGSWWWPGKYLWPASFFGRTWPLDDIIIWYFLSTPVLIGGYEFFVDGD